MLRRITAPHASQPKQDASTEYRSTTYADYQSAQEQYAWLAQHSTVPCHLLTVQGGYQIVAARNPYPSTYNRVQLAYTDYITAFQWRDARGALTHHFTCRTCAENIEAHRVAGDTTLRGMAYDFLAPCWQAMLGWQVGTSAPSAHCSVCHKPLVTR